MNPGMQLLGVLFPTEDRFKMYDETRKLRGKIRTYKGDIKSLSSLTDKEADEFLAEEFRRYVLADGQYTIGETAKKSWLDRMLDKIFKALSFFIKTPKAAQLLMSRIHKGAFAGPTNNFTAYTGEGAFMEAQRLSATLINNTVEGMTVHLFNIANRQGIFEIEDFFDLSKKEGITTNIKKLYGDPKSFVKGEEKVINKIIGSLNGEIKRTQGKLTNVISKSQKEYLTRELSKLVETKTQIQNNWELLIDEHSQFLERYKIELNRDETSEEDKTGKAFDIPQHEIDPNLLLPHPVRLLIATLPATRETKYRDGKGKNKIKHVFEVNTSGLPKLVDFGNTMNYLYKELSNMNPTEIFEVLESLSQARPEIKVLISRLGIDTGTELQNKTESQVRMLVRFMMQFESSK